MVEAPQMTRLEASADVPLASRTVWDAILDGSRWPDWMASGDVRTGWLSGRPRLTLDHVTPFFRPAGGRDGASCAVGDIRRESAVVSRPFGLGVRRVEWHSVVTDIDDGRSIEIASPAVGGLREWRLRVNILPTGVQPLPSWFRLAPPVDRGDGIRRNVREQAESTRVRAILTYRPVNMVSRLLNHVSIRSLVQARLEAWIAGLARSLSARSDLESRAISDPVRYLPVVGRPAISSASSGSESFRSTSRATGQYPAARAAVASVSKVAPSESGPSSLSRLAGKSLGKGATAGIDDIGTKTLAEAHTTASLLADEADFLDAAAVVEAPNVPARPVPARAVPHGMSAPLPPVTNPSEASSQEDRFARSAGTEASGAQEGFRLDTERGLPEATVPADVAVPIERRVLIPEEPPVTPVPALASVNLLDITLQVVEESASTYLAATTTRDPAPFVPPPIANPAPKGRVETDQSMSRRVGAGAGTPQLNSPTGVRVPTPRPMLMGDRDPTTISASAIAASRRLALMAANRSVIGLGAAVKPPTQAVAVGGGAAAGDASPTSTTAVDASSNVATPVPTIGAVANASRATATGRGDACPPSAPGLPTEAHATPGASALPPPPAVSPTPEPSIATTAREDASPASSNAAA